MKRLCAVLYLSIVAASLGVAQQASISITYIGNMGVAISDSQRSVLVDGLHTFYRQDYLHPPKSLTNKLIHGEELSFGTPAIALVTHMHKDHFDEKLVGEFLLENPDVIVVGSEQSIEKVEPLLKKSDQTSDPGQQLRLLDYNLSSKQTIKHQGITITAFRSPHTYPQRHRKIQNVAYIISIAGRNVLHMGDSDWEFAEELLARLDIKNMGIDIAIMPFWMMLSPTHAQKLEKYIAPQQIISTHVSPLMGDEDMGNIYRNFPKATIFTIMGEKHVYPK